MSFNINKDLVSFLTERFRIEREKFDRSGVYAYTQRLLAYNSNKIEGSTLTEEQTASLFDNGILPKTNDYYRAKDVEETNGHFLMFNKMLDTLDQPLTQKLIKQFHYELKSGVFEDRANGYAIGDYKKRPNMIGMYHTVRPENIEAEMEQLLDWYSCQTVDIPVLAEFHARYESIHPFQDGNGRTGRLIIFRECLKNGIVPIVIEDANRNEYLDTLKEFREGESLDKLIELFRKEQEFYLKECRYFTNID
ncbi:MAG: Fic family protein [Butyrivibrio sp.]|nr:Fic family protein [Butyrivibrio sp.]